MSRIIFRGRIIFQPPPAMLQRRFWPAAISIGTLNITNASGGNAHTTLPPAIVLPYILRII